ncbi:MAG TPA: histidine kinase, partial [Puia sp.]|nr:histidine kinase [Puia sp.]
PGEYTFLVKTKKQFGDWGPVNDSLSISVAPAFWQTALFRLLCLVLVAACTWWLLRRRIGRVRQESELKRQIAETEMRALRAQMNPHFIFNCISGIDSLIQCNDKYNATTYLNKFAKLIRNVLESSKNETIPLWKDIETLKLYVELEAMRNDNEFHFDFDIDPILLRGDYHVPSLIVQPYIENAIHHGIRNRQDDQGRLEITIRAEESFLIYRITDNGVGRKAAAEWSKSMHQSYGLAVSQERINLFNRRKTKSVIITDLYDNNDEPLGTQVIVKLSLN